MGKPNSRHRGQQGEALALNYLSNKGYRLLEKNYRCKRSEIDLIMQFDLTLVFVEVKYRSTSDYGYPEEFVSRTQKKSILTAAENYLFDKSWDGPIRFDIIAISAKNSIEHFEDAFY